jgi:hypothetical protein
MHAAAAAAAKCMPVHACRFMHAGSSSMHAAAAAAAAAAAFVIGMHAGGSYLLVYLGTVHSCTYIYIVYTYPDTILVALNLVHAGPCMPVHSCQPLLLIPICDRMF